MVSTKKTPAKAAKTAAESRQQGKEWNYTHIPPSSDDRFKNGRRVGRNLVTWTRPRMSEKLLLHIQYECTRHGINLPWDLIAHRLNPGSSGGAIVQWLNRLRGTLVAEGHLVPPIGQKPGSKVVVNQEIRGYVRKFPDGDDTISTRAVMFSEPLEDRKHNLPGFFTQPDGPDSAKQENIGGRRRARKQALKKEPSSVQANLDSDADHAGAATSEVQRRSTRAIKKPKIQHVAENNDDYLEEDYDDQDVARDVATNANATYQNLQDDEARYEADDENFSFNHFQRPIERYTPRGIQGADAYGLGIYNNVPYAGHSGRAAAAPAMAYHQYGPPHAINRHPGYQDDLLVDPDNLPEESDPRGYTIAELDAEVPNVEVPDEDDHDEDDLDEDDHDEEDREQEPSEYDADDDEYNPDSD